MAKRKKTPKEAMKYWRVGPKGLKIKARTARVAARIYIRNNLARDRAIAYYELDNPCSGLGDPSRFLSDHPKIAKRLNEEAKSQHPSTVKVTPW